MEANKFLIRSGLIALAVVVILDLIAFLMLMGMGVTASSMLLFTTVFSALAFPIATLGLEFYSQATYLNIENKTRSYLLLGLLPPICIGLLAFLINILVESMAKA